MVGGRDQHDGGRASMVDRRDQYGGWAGPAWWVGGTSMMVGRTMVGGAYQCCAKSSCKAC